MKIQDIRNEIIDNLSKIVDFDPSALIYCKSTENGDFTIHSARLKAKSEGNDEGSCKTKLNDICRKNNPAFKKEDYIFLKNINDVYKSKSIVKTTVVKQNLYFSVDKKAIAEDIVRTIILENEKYGESDKKEGLYVVEYSSPNIAKKFHPGHLRTTILGNFIKNLLKISGYDVYSINYLGDWGKQFGLIGVGFSKYGCEEEMKKDPIKHLYEVYVKINKDKEEDETVDLDAKKWFLELENGDKEKYALWKRFRDMSVEKYKELYKKLNVEFDEYSGESFYFNEGRKVIEKLSNKTFDDQKSVSSDNQNSGEKIKEKSDPKIQNKNLNIDENKNFIIDDDDGSKYIETKYGKLCVIKNDGSTLYSTRDIAAAFDRVERLKPRKILYVVASQQDLYFKQLFDIFKFINLGEKEKIKDEFLFQHINYGMVDGMSTRKGTVVFLEDIINEAKEVMLSRMKMNEKKFSEIKDVEKTCEILAVSALVIQDFSAKRIKNYTFNMERNTETTGFTGPYLQFLHCRLVSIEEKNKLLMDEIISIQNNKSISDNEKNKNKSIEDIKKINKESKEENNYNRKINDKIKPIDLELKMKNMSITEDNAIFSCFNPDLLDQRLYEILFLLTKYPLTIEKCLVNYEPSTLVTYLMDLSKDVSGIINDYRVMGVEKELAISRLCFFKCVRIVVGNGLKLLGLTPLERM